MSAETMIGLLVAFLLGLVSGGFLVHYREDVAERASERRKRRGLRAEIEGNLDRLQRHRDERWPTALLRQQWDDSMQLALRSSTRAQLRATYALVDQYNQRIAQEYKLASGTRTEDFVHFAAGRVDPAAVENAFRGALQTMDSENLGILGRIVDSVRSLRRRQP